MMDKSWIQEWRVGDAYDVGVKRFLDFAFSNASPSEVIIYPCKNCSNLYYKSRDVVYEHLICDGFDKGYARNVRIFHRELRFRQMYRNVTLDEDAPKSEASLNTGGTRSFTWIHEEVTS